MTHLRTPTKTRYVRLGGLHEDGGTRTSTSPSPTPHSAAASPRLSPWVSGTPVGDPFPVNSTPSPFLRRTAASPGSKPSNAELQKTVSQSLAVLTYTGDPADGYLRPFSL